MLAPWVSARLFTTCLYKDYANGALSRNWGPEVPLQYKY